MPTDFIASPLHRFVRPYWPRWVGSIAVPPGVVTDSFNPNGLCYDGAAPAH
jgi:hypothetical protein